VDSYVVELKPSARKELELLPDGVLARVVHKMELLGQDPRPAGCKKLKGYKDQWRIRVGDWRVLYIVDDLTKGCQCDADRAPARGLSLIAIIPAQERRVACNSCYGSQRFLEERMAENVTNDLCAGLSHANPS
jgi:mRNA interferase RelE/StbE